jgi:hypothetical protein
MKSASGQMVNQLLLVLVLFQIKHLLADFVLQSAYILNNRKIYGHPGGLLHVAIHLLGSLASLMIIGCTPQTLLIVLLAEAVIHYHIDWTKDNILAARSWTPKDANFWYLLGFDQFLHQLTYLGMVYYLSATMLPT